MWRTTIARSFACVLMLMITRLDTCGANLPNGVKYCADRTKACVAREQCLEGQINVFGFGIYSERFDDDGECDGPNVVCCSLPLSYTESPKVSTKSPEVSTKSSEESAESPNHPDWSGECGESDVQGAVTGSKTKRWEFPWTVALFSVSKTSYGLKKTFLGGGTLIDDQVVLTAARCVHQKNASTLLVQLGRWNLSAGKETFMQELGVDKFVLHRSYVPSSQLHNIALLFLNESAHIGRASNRVCLHDGQNFVSDSTCYVVGWSDSPPPNTANTQLRLEAQQADRKECAEKIRSSTGSWEYHLPKEHLCADYTDSPVPCERAPGSGMVCALQDKPNQFFLVGVASHALRNCDQYSAKDVFVGTQHYISWIDQVMTRNNRYPNYYRPDA